MSAPTAVAVVANVRLQTWRGQDHEPQVGTKHFGPGAKVWVAAMPKWSSDLRVDVLGHHRGSPRLIAMTMHARDLACWRRRVEYSPTLVKLVRRHYWTDERAAEFIAAMLEIQDMAGLSRAACGHDDCAAAPELGAVCVQVSRRGKSPAATPSK